MTKKNKKKPQMIDMSGRLDVNIVIADETEIAENEKYFQELNESIEAKIEESTQRIDKYVKSLLIDSDLL